MITCQFEHGNPALLRHVTADVVGVREGLVLMVRRAAHLVEGEKWALPGGYMDRDETWAGAALREFREETGHECFNPRLFDIDSRAERVGDDRQNVTGVFLVDVGDQLHEPDQESTGLRWFSFAEIAEMPDIAFEHGRYTAAVEHYLREPFSLPLLDGRPMSDL